MSSPRSQPEKPLTPREAWQPFTPRGVAAFAYGTLTRTMLVQLAIAVVVASAVIWFLRVAWFPVVTEAIEALPDTGMVRHGQLALDGDPQRVLAQNKRLALAVDVSGSGESGHAADVQLTFEKNGFAFCGALGCWRQAYPPDYWISFNRLELEPTWGAWRGPILALVGLATILSLYVLWWIVALVYVPVIKLIAFFTDRVVTWRGAWRQSAAALLPGALLVAVGMVMYGFVAVDLFQLGLLYALHLVCGAVFAVTSPFFLTRISKAPRSRNPFGPPNAP